MSNLKSAETVPNPVRDGGQTARIFLCARRVRRNQYKNSLKIDVQSVLRLPEKLPFRREMIPGSSRFPPKHLTDLRPARLRISTMTMVVSGIDRRWYHLSFEEKNHPSMMTTLIISCLIAILCFITITGSLALSLKISGTRRMILDEALSKVACGLVMCPASAIAIGPYQNPNVPAAPEERCEHC